MRKSLAAICAAIMLTLVVAPLAHATEVNVRIEGKEETLFEKTIPVSIQKIEASSDTQERNCDGVNELDPENVEPEITPTLASAEAMESIGETFDGEWYDGFGDYFITRFGPDEQDNSLSAWWGILVNNVFTSVGGCQKQLHEDDEVLWVWNAFSGRPTLALFPEAAHYTEGPRPTRIVAEAGEPIPLEVVSWGEGGEGNSPEVPSRSGSSGYEGADISPVTVNPKGFQRIDTASPETVVSGTEGKATVTYEAPGVYRIKATVGAVPGIEETVVRSNGLEICVEAEVGECDAGGTPGESGGGETPGDGQSETPTTGGGTTPEAEPTTTDQIPAAHSEPAPAITAAPPAPTPPTPAPVQIGRPRFDRGRIGDARLGLNWPVLAAGPGLRGFKVGVRPMVAGGDWTTRAHGATATGATVRLGHGRRFRLRLTLTDLNGQTTSYDLGTVTVPTAGQS